MYKGETMKKIYLFIYILLFFLFLLNFVIIPRQPLPFSHIIHLLLIISGAAISLGSFKQNNRISGVFGISIIVLVCISWIIKSIN